MNKEILIEKYLQNRLSYKDKQVFDRLLKEDPSFKEEVSFHKNLQKAVQDQDQDNFKELLNTIESGVRKKENKPTFRLYSKWLVAAGFVLLFGISYFLQIKNSYNPDALFNQNFVPYKNVIYPVNRGGNTNQDIKSKAFLAYEKGDYQKAIDLFSTLYSNTKEPYYLFYKANALLKLNKTKEAILILKEHLKTKDTLSDKSNWYLALAYIKLNETKKAKELLHKISENQLYNYKKAKKLLKKLP